jgi:1-aminocyclopropane-1-carboxylate deaminase/D-cysteine desulfhydrase-like pyridoxal-dependent ACC family enzyme
VTLAALFDVYPALTGKLPWVTLGEWPTPIQRLALPQGEVWVKRDDVSGAVYGGNKVRTLEALFGQARAAGARRIWAVGAYGSNHALATVLHAPAAELAAGTILFPQPPSECAAENLVATLGARPEVVRLWSWAGVPWAMFVARRDRRSFVMVPGGATPDGALGYVSAALELAAQVSAGAAPTPARIYVGTGSTCTAAGLLVGLWLAARRGILGARPLVCAVRVTPWPVTAAWRIVSLAARTARRLAELTGEAAAGRAELAAGLRVVAGFLGRGYGYATEAGARATETFARVGGPPLDPVYTAKSAAGMLAQIGAGPGPVFYWATKSSRALPPPDGDALAAAPRAMARWLARADPNRRFFLLTGGGG